MSDYGMRFGEEPLRQVLARRAAPDAVSVEGEPQPERDFAARVRAAGPPPAVTVELTGEAALTYKQVQRALAGRYGLPLEWLPVEVAEFVRDVGRVLEVEAESQWLFVKSHGHWKLPPGAYCLISEGVKPAFTWWLDTAVLEGKVRVPAGWWIRGTDSPCVMGVYPVGVPETPEGCAGRLDGPSSL